MLPSVASFDVFDTILARNVTKPTDVFHLVEARTGVAGFAAARMQAESASWATLAVSGRQAWDEIYEHYQRITGCSTEERLSLQAAELTAEASVVFLVQEVACAVRPGDILVSDMYLPPAAVKALLDAAGFRTPVTLFVSQNGKGSGAMWAALRDRYVITQHTGDNAHADVKKAKEHGIPAVLTTVSHTITPVEAVLRDAGAVTLALHLRRFRLGLPKPQFKASRHQTDINTFITARAAAELARIVQTERLSTVLLITRDGCMVEHVLPHLVPEGVAVRRFHCSRKMHTDPSEEYKAYVRRNYVPGSTIIFDVFGSFQTGRALYMELFGSLPRVHIFVRTPHSGAEPYDGLTCSLVGIDGWLEALSLDTVGQLVAMDAQGNDYRAPPEYCVKAAEEARAIMMAYGEYVAAHAAVFQDCDLLVPSEILQRLLSEAFRHSYREEDIPLKVRVALNGVDLTQMANRFRSDKGTTEACAHGYTKHYERLFARFAPRDKVVLAEIGLNRDGEVSAPSLDMWDTYFGYKRVRMVGVDNRPEFTALQTPDGQRTIVIADQSKREDLTAVCAQGPFDIIIDDGFHASRHQQVSLDVLWDSVAPGGLYIIEDLHFQPFAEADPANETLAVLEDWAAGRHRGTPYITGARAAHICAGLRSITLLPSYSKSPRWAPAKLAKAFAVLHKAGE